jgi:hypothetical protein
MKKIFTFSLILVVFFLIGYDARSQSISTTMTGNNINYYNGQVPKKANKEFQFLAFFINQGVNTNMYPKSSLFNGQLVGRLFGPNSSTTSDSLTSNYVEQRLIPFFIYQPKLFNGKAA